jgi:lactate dehydrogenase-like 2-hydroxyacid dehydrogenase
MSSVKIVYPIPSAFKPEQISKLKQSYPKIKFYDTFPEKKDELIERINEAEIVIASSLNFYYEDSIFQSCPRLKYIICLAVGYQNMIDVEQASKRNIRVSNIPGFNIQAVAEMAFGLLLNLIKKISKVNAEFKKGWWPENEFDDWHLGQNLQGKEFLQIGYGSIGQKIAKFAEAFGCRVNYINSRTGSDEIQKLLSEADVISMTLPSNPSTLNFMNKERLNNLKETAFLINVGRRSTLDQKYLLKLLTEEKIAGAGLDVYTNEPQLGENPIFEPELEELINLPNVTATPHIAADTYQTLENLQEELIKILDAYFQNKPIYLVNEK